MDENYLDDLLKGVSTDNQKKNSFDKTVDKDSGVDIDFADLDDISLDELDSLDDLSLDELDFDDLDDVDFDDLDVTNLNSKNSKISSEYIPEKEEFNADDMLAGIDAIEEFDTDDVDESDMSADEAISEMDLDSLLEEVSEEPDIPTATTSQSDNGFLNPEDIDSLFSQLEGDEKEASETDNSNDATGFADDFTDMFSQSGGDDSNDIENMDLDDLFSALGIDETEGVATDNYVSGESDLDQLLQATMVSSFDDSALSDIEDISEKPSNKKGKKNKSGSKEKGTKEKKSIQEILFGAPDEDDEEEERLFEIKKAEKEAKKAKQKEDSEAKKALKQEKLQQKNEDNAKKQSEKAEKKRLKEAELIAELEAEKGQKTVPTPVVILVFAAFIALGFLVVLGAKGFNYSQVIKKATNYFERQRYRLAYEEVAGVEVKEEDEELRDRIYTVMYVERLYESYENNMTLNRPDKALDSLLRGLGKYDEHYEEAVALGIAKDIKSVKEKIVNALWNTYGLTEAAAYELMKLEGVEYSDALIEASEGLMPTGE